VELTGKVAVVTGGGRGIGRGIVDRFLQEGARVAVVQRNGADAALLGHPDVVVLQEDLSDTSVCASVAQQTARHFGGIDILVNNAGCMAEVGVDDVTEGEWDRMVALNLRAPLFLTQAVLPRMRARGGGSIINIGSIEGLGSNPQHTLYSATKAGLHGMTRALAVDLGPDGIRCNTIAPGWIGTDLSEAYLDSMPDPAGAREALASLHPLRRTGTAANVGDVAVFLASDRAGFMTGETLVVDGGRTVQLSSPR
jgi:meso-butanediol dehydrogenase/(S,S)-butanediol dehydrogenase/diacetyl reductase